LIAVIIRYQKFTDIIDMIVKAVTRVQHTI